MVCDDFYPLGLNWGSYKGRLFIPADIHRKMAAVIVEAHAYHLPDRPGYFVHASTPDYSKHVSNSDKVSLSSTPSPLIMILVNSVHI